MYLGFSLVGEAGTLLETALRSEIYSQNNSILTFVKLARRLLWVIWSNLPSLTLGLGWSSRFPRLRISGWGIRRKSSLATQQHSYTVTQPLLHSHTYGNTHLLVHRSISENSCHIFLKQMMWSWVTIALQRWSQSSVLRVPCLMNWHQFSSDVWQIMACVLISCHKKPRRRALFRILSANEKASP